MHRHLFLLLITALCGYGGASAQEWTLKKDDNGVKVYSKDSEHSKYNELRVEMTLQTSLSSVAALVLDIGNYPNWCFNTKKASILKTVSPAELYFYSEIHTPWPVSNRDLAVHLLVTQDPNSKIMTIHAVEIPGYIPIKEGLVRVPVSDETWTVTPAGNGYIKIDYRITLDPGAGTPAWLINMFSVKGPFETFSHVKDQLKIAKYRDAKLSFIKD